jgi:nucleotide-binding universal stress UspA family protein
MGSAGGRRRLIGAALNPLAGPFEDDSTASSARGDTAGDTRGAESTVTTSMPPFHSVLCAVDFSDESRNALRWAVALAARSRGSVTVLNAVEPLLAHAAQARYGIELATAEVQPALREFVAATMPKDAPWLPAVTCDVIVGEAPRTILDAANRRRADLIVVGTRGLGGLSKFVLGSTTERVLRETAVPVLAVPAEAVSAALEASGPTLTIGLVLAAADFSDASGRAVQQAAELAASFSAPLVIVHAIAPVAALSRWQPYAELAGPARVPETRERLEHWLMNLPTPVRGELVVTVGRPADAITAAAADRGAGMIVMGLIAEDAVAAPRPGSVAYQVLSTARTPVFVVAPGGR